jgi:hypothetical protein
MQQTLIPTYNFKYECSYNNVIITSPMQCGFETKADNGSDHSGSFHSGYHGHL